MIPAHEGTRRIDLDSHRREAEEEDVAWLMDRCGLTFTEACARVGVPVDVMRLRDRRAGRPWR